MGQSNSIEKNEFSKNRCHRRRYMCCCDVDSESNTNCFEMGKDGMHGNVSSLPVLPEELGQKITTASGLQDPDVPEHPVTIAIIGAGNRGQVYAEFASVYPQFLKVVAVVDIHDYKRQEMAKKHNVPPENTFKHYKEFIKRPKLCDAVAICTTDREHTVPAVACADLKYHILLEKPMSTNVEECVQICEAVVKNNVILAVGHVLRYTIYTQAIKKILDSKILGDIINIQHSEDIGFWHFAHSYVRGNWHKESESTFSLLAKSCHDIDLLAYFMDSKFKKVSSFGRLSHFRKENKPAAAGNAK